MSQIDEEYDEDFETEEIVSTAEPGSVLAQLQAAAAAQQEEKFTDLPVGGSFGDLLQIRYRPLDQTQMDRFIAKRQRILERGGGISDVSATDASCDLIAQACVALTARGEILEHNGAAVRMDARLADLLEIPFPEGFEPTARDVILKVFGGNAMAIDSHATKLMEWMQGSSEVSGLGESSAGG